MKKVSIIIVNYNGQRFLKRLLESIEFQTFRDFETIFVDNDSSDMSVDFVRNNFPESRIIQAENRGFGTSCNLAVKSANGKNLLFLNEDMYLPEDFLENIISYKMKLESKRKHIGGISCKLIDFDSSPEKASRTFGARMDFFGFPVKNKNPDNIFIISGCPFLITKELFLASGGFNENIFLYGEDMDLSWRLRLFGYSNYICHDTHIFHFGGGVTGDFGPAKIANNIFSSCIPVFSNYHWLTLIIIVPLYLVYILFLSIAIFIFKKLDLLYLKEICGKYMTFLKNIKKVYKFRKFVQKKRARSDFFIFRYVSFIPAFIVNASYKKLLSTYIIKNC
jgi:GT2 family glycosyltransferase